MDPFRLNTQLLKIAYASGYFPMPHPETEEILWFDPDPRAILPPDAFHCSRSLTRTLRRGLFRVTFDEAFPEVMAGCADRNETWINAEFMRAYTQLFQEGCAHSVEVWLKDHLVGGLYGVTLGGAFFAESKFHRETDASKVALHALCAHLAKRGFVLLEVQFLTAHLATLGAREIPAKTYHEMLKRAIALPVSFLDSPSPRDRTNNKGS